MENNRKYNKNPINSSTIQKYPADLMKTLHVVIERLPISFLKTQITATAKHSAALTNGSSKKMVNPESVTKITTSAEVTRDKSMKSDSICWRRSKYGRKHSHYNNEKLYSLIQLHNHFIHVITFLIEMMSVVALDQKHKEFNKTTK